MLISKLIQSITLHQVNPLALQHNPKLPLLSPTPSPSWCRTNQTVTADQAETCMPEKEATTAQPFVSFYFQQNKGEKHVPQRMLFCSQHSSSVEGCTSTTKRENIGNGSRQVGNKTTGLSRSLDFSMSTSLRKSSVQTCLNHSY